MRWKCIACWEGKRWEKLQLPFETSFRSSIIFRAILWGSDPLSNSPVENRRSPISTKNVLTAHILSFIWTVWVGSACETSHLYLWPTLGEEKDFTNLCSLNDLPEIGIKWWDSLLPLANAANTVFHIGWVHMHNSCYGLFNPNLDTK